LNRKLHVFQNTKRGQDPIFSAAFVALTFKLCKTTMVVMCVCAHAHAHTKVYPKVFGLSW